MSIICKSSKRTIMTISKAFRTDNRQPYLFVEFQFNVGTAGQLTRVQATFRLGGQSDGSSTRASDSSSAVDIQLSGNTAIELKLSNGRIGGTCVAAH
jgi:hypothetical protein